MRFCAKFTQRKHHNICTNSSTFPCQVIGLGPCWIQAVISGPSWAELSTKILYRKHSKIFHLKSRCPDCKIMHCTRLGTTLATLWCTSSSKRKWMIGKRCSFITLLQWRWQQATSMAIVCILEPRFLTSMIWLISLQLCANWQIRPSIRASLSSGSCWTWLCGPGRALSSSPN